MILSGKIVIMYKIKNNCKTAFEHMLSLFSTVRFQVFKNDIQYSFKAKNIKEWLEKFKINNN